MLRSKLCTGTQSGTLFSCCVSNEDPSEKRIDRSAIGPPMDFRHLAHMGVSGGNEIATSSPSNRPDLNDLSAPRAPLPAHLKLIELSEALAVHNASAAVALQAKNQAANATALTPALHAKSCCPETVCSVRKSTPSRLLTSGPLPPPPPPPPPSAMIS
ncbi:unnamed protein product [Mesocestoides corti]|uniref:CRIB domain-containing protein n=1 Tax=Mesocestoides corti TaxID=53468 RepID=A0A0R3U3S3_MESCO|nr:unnamed protein product [Mesocestoides corti]